MLDAQCSDDSLSKDAFELMLFAVIARPCTIAELLFPRCRIPRPELFETKHSGTGIARLRKEDRKQKKGKHKCRNGFGEGDKIVARLGIEVLPPPASRNMRLGMVYRGAHQVLRELENAVYQQGKNNDGNHGYRFLPLRVYASFY